eukprot:gene2474-2848_t
MASLPAGAFKGHKLLTKKGELVASETALADKKVIAVYFSAHWCPPCRQFTPMLKQFFEELQSQNKSFTIIFVSSDQTEADMKAYFAEHGDYYACPFDDKEMAGTLSENCGVSGIPMLCIVDKSGKMLHSGGRGDVMKGPTCFPKWEGLSK